MKAETEAALCLDEPRSPRSSNRDRPRGSERQERHVAPPAREHEQVRHLESPPRRILLRQGNETLRGNRTIEDFSPLHRLYRDAIVFESWKETSQQSSAPRTCATSSELDAVRADRRARGHAGRARRAAPPLGRQCRSSAHFTAVRQLDQLVQSAAGNRPFSETKQDCAELIERSHLVPGSEPEGPTRTIRT